ncbi:hypothetical protein [Brevibacillus sp. MER 51]|uniref:hypothetical protein n=1 Tax=Brevibacillus sp. MER 51 TaxID=2939560 RepID=UPI002040F5E1|nr:hypothetical protein [Brevibacillus sp. MER 51]MCM3144352.1 hypothetical protein [Brevibacillus sp. MER 51]
MNCNLKQCEWNAFDQCCCAEVEDVHVMATPNLTSCTFFFNQKEKVEEARQEYVGSLLAALEEMNFSAMDEARQILPNLSSDQLLKEGEWIEKLYGDHQVANGMSAMLDELQAIGSDAFRAKYLT